MATKKKSGALPATPKVKGPVRPRRFPLARVYRAIVCCDPSPNNPDGLRGAYRDNPRKFLRAEWAGITAEWGDRVGAMVEFPLGMPAHSPKAGAPKQPFYMLREPARDTLAELAAPSALRGPIPIVCSGFLTPKAIASWGKNGFAVKVDDAMGRQDLLVQFSREAREYQGASIVLGETVPIEHDGEPLRGRGFAMTSATIDEVPGWSFRFGTFGRQVVMKHDLTPPVGAYLYAMFFGKDDVQPSEVAWLRDRGYGLMLQGIGPNHPAAVEIRETIAKGW